MNPYTWTTYYKRFADKLKIANPNSSQKDLNIDYIIGLFSEFPNVAKIYKIEPQDLFFSA